MSVYISEKGDEVEVGTMNSFRLVNGLVKMAGILALNPNGFGDADAEYQVIKDNVQNLSAEIISRLAPPPAE